MAQRSVKQTKVGSAAQEDLEAPEHFCAEICTGNKQNCCLRPVGLILVMISALVLSGACRCWWLQLGNTRGRTGTKSGQRCRAGATPSAGTGEFRLPAP